MPMAGMESACVCVHTCKDSVKVSMGRKECDGSFAPTHVHPREWRQRALPSVLGRAHCPEHTCDVDDMFKILLDSVEHC